MKKFIEIIKEIIIICFLLFITFIIFSNFVLFLLTPLSKTNIIETNLNEKKILEEEEETIINILDLNSFKDDIKIIKISFEEPFRHETTYEIIFSISDDKYEALKEKVNKYIYQDISDNEQKVFKYKGIVMHTKYDENYIQIKRIVEKYK